MSSYGQARSRPRNEATVLMLEFHYAAVRNGAINPSR